MKTTKTINPLSVAYVLEELINQEVPNFLEIAAESKLTLDLVVGIKKKLDELGTIDLVLAHYNTKSTSQDLVKSFTEITEVTNITKDIIEEKSDIAAHALLVKILLVSDNIDIKSEEAPEVLSLLAKALVGINNSFNKTEGVFSGQFHEYNKEI